ncbi:cyclopropane-fatty-acyl-phospholipid synthase family protein [Phenylobacterium sp. J367]|uniref:SAM-dependent methyltransferase n=1 Tax=Phenylobacterium sp. J367 TaxID=2898435 RepID=UPI0021511145|nr:cyclopropane-fatty-acyl-phospholipid synthase family protein [Phenylobacterium sp. J367]MCR5879238.1 cyclopropane-fatty-acyl-phospholipid synthase family protein [Phenylobacterium sp. J367]
MIETLLSEQVKVGDLTVRMPGGREIHAGDGTGPPVVVRVTARGVRRIAAKPGLGLGEAFMDEDLVFERGTVWDLLELTGRSGSRLPKGRGGWLKRTRRAIRRRLQQANARATARANVAHHYDVSNDLYRRFLDEDLQYSCAYFARPDMTLEEAQAAKKRHIAAKLRLSPGQRVLDIGCGWGGLAMTLARDFGVEVLGVTLSTEQLDLAQRRIAAAGLEDRVRIELADYRDLAGTFDRVVSVGMLEHVGAPNLRAYFQVVRDRLAEDGVALIHTIGRMEGPSLTNAFTRKYIFPGGYIPALSEVSRAVEEAGLWITDVEVLRLHYAETLRQWRERFLADPEIPELWDARFRRMWEFYLASAEVGFRYGGHMNLQVQLTRRVDVLPVTRTYMAD